MSVIDHIDRQLANLAEMMRRLDIDPSELMQEGLDRQLSGVVQTCEVCGSSSECGDWLIHAAARLDRAPPFCPNVERLRRLAPRRPKCPRTDLH